MESREERQKRTEEKWQVQNTESTRVVPVLEQNLLIEQNQEAFIRKDNIDQIEKIKREQIEEEKIKIEYELIAILSQLSKKTGHQRDGLNSMCQVLDQTKKVGGYDKRSTLSKEIQKYIYLSENNHYLKKKNINKDRIETLIRKLGGWKKVYKLSFRMQDYLLYGENKSWRKVSCINPEEIIESKIEQVGGWEKLACLSKKLQSYILCSGNAMWRIRKGLVARRKIEERVIELGGWNMMGKIPHKIQDMLLCADNKKWENVKNTYVSQDRVERSL